MGLMATKKGGDFEIAPEGVHPARCYRVIDLGTQQTEWMGQKKQAHKVMLTWELLGDERMADGRPFSISKRYTVSTHEKSSMRKDLESWRGRKFSPEEEAAFNIGNVAGAYCLINVTHNQGADGNTYANVASIMPLPKSMGKPAGVNEVQIFDIDKPDMTMFASFSEKLKATIVAAAEWNNPKEPEDDIPWTDNVDDTANDPIPF